MAAAVRKNRSAVVVGIDPRAANLPPGLKPDGSLASTADCYEQFGCEIIDVVAGKVAAVKPQMAFFEQLGPAGMQALFRVIQHARRQDMLVILDGKRNDIGSTATAYAQAYLGPESSWQADALTVSPYLGTDSLEPFVTTARQRDAGIFVLVKTSNPGGKTLQDRVAGDATIYQHVGRIVQTLGQDLGGGVGESGYHAIGAVVGATYPDQLAEMRGALPGCWFLVPGYGAQGGNAADVAAAFDADGLGAVVNSSRGIIFAYERPEYASAAARSWQAAVESATADMNQQLAAAGAIR